MPNYFKNDSNSNNPPFLFSDPQLVPRVRQYIDENRNRQYVDITMMSDNLQRRYPRDYARRKRIAFRGMVSRVYTYLLQQNSSPAKDNSFSSLNNSNINQSDLYSPYSNDASNGRTKVEDEDDAQDDDIIVDIPDKDPNFVNKQLATMYSSSPNVKKNNHNTSKAAENDQELISLSSDEDTNVEKTNAKKRSKTAKLVQEEDVNVASPASVEPTPSNTEIPTTKGQKRKAGEASLHSGIPSLRRKKREIPLTKSTVTLKDVGGNRKTIEDVIKLLIHLKHPEVYKTIGVTLPRGFLLHGPPGCGKTLLAHAIAGELDLPLLKVAGPELVAGVSGESEERIRDLFEQAVSLAPCILFIDEVDVISSRRESAHRNMEQRIVAQLLCSLDSLDNAEKGSQVLVIGATNRHDSMDPALRRAGRFDREICLGIPDKKSRLQILQILVANMKLSKNVGLEQLAALTPGYVGADLKSLTREAAIAAVSRICEDVKIKRMKIAQQQPNKIVENGESKEVNDEIIIEDPSDDITILPEPSKNNENSDKNSDCDILEIDGISSEAEKNNQDVIVEKSFVVSEDRLKESINSYYQADDKTDSADTSVTKFKADKQDSGDTEQPMEVEETNDTSASNLSKEEEKENPDKSKFYCSFSLNSKEAIDESIESLLEWLRDKTPLSESELSELFVEFSDFEKALKTVQPSSKREGFATVPDVTWDDVGSLSDIRQELQMAILAPVQHSELFARLGLTSPTGVLLCGPPGCGKTLLAKAVANEAGINFISVKGPELLNMYLGESERAVRQCFERARNSQPCVIFFDELDALCPKRSESRDSGGGMRVVNQLLTEMDGVEGRQGVFLMAATNRPDMIDPAVLRPGRLDKILYVGLPTPDGRVDILKALTKNGTCPALNSDVNLEEVGQSEKCEGFSGADLAALVREAGVQALREYLEEPSSTQGSLEAISLRHFEAALKKIRRSVSDKDRIYYEKLQLFYSPSLNSSSNKAEKNEAASSPKS